MTLQAVRAEEKGSSVLWESAIAAFEAEDQRQAPAEGGIVFVGSSSIRLWDVRQSFPDLPVINRGFGGSQVTDAVFFTPRIVTKYRPRTVVFYSGDNDLAFGKSPETVASDVAKFVDRVRQDLPTATIFLLSIKPSVARASIRGKQIRANELIEAMAKQQADVKFVDVFSILLDSKGEPRPELFLPDQLHLNEAGYKVWTEKLRPMLR
jgi:lysophospholipase L1-like esterase